MSDIRLIPRFVVPDFERALRFYEAAFGARLTECHRDDEGRVVHAELAIGEATLFVKDADRYDPAPASPGPIVTLYVPDSDAVYARALAAGAEVIFPLATQEYGERGARIRDPSGHQWIVTTLLPGRAG